VEQWASRLLRFASFQSGSVSFSQLVVHNLDNHIIQIDGGSGGGGGQCPWLTGRPTDAAARGRNWPAAAAAAEGWPCRDPRGIFIGLHRRRKRRCLRRTDGRADGLQRWLVEDSSGVAWWAREERRPGGTRRRKSGDSGRRTKDARRILIRRRRTDGGRRRHDCNERTSVGQRTDCWRVTSAAKRRAAAAAADTGDRGTGPAAAAPGGRREKDRETEWTVVFHPYSTRLRGDSLLSQPSTNAVGLIIQRLSALL